MARECRISVRFREEGPTLYERVRALLEQMARKEGEPWRRG